MNAKVSIVEAPPLLAAPTGLTELPIAILSPFDAAFQYNAFQLYAFQMSPVTPPLTDQLYPATVTIIEIG
jgi:hypothetical protein